MIANPSVLRDGGRAAGMMVMLHVYFSSGDETMVK